VVDGAGPAAIGGQLAVLVKASGVLGTYYLAAIRPFRRLIVYLRLTREIERAWRAGGRPSDASSGFSGGG
jgi:Protein of unknown function (DUF2867)